MRRILLITLLCTLLWSCEKTDPETKVIKDLIARVTPGYEKQFRLEIIDRQSEGDDVYEIDTDGRKIVLRGNCPVALASAYNWYLKYYCNAHLSWTGDQLDLPSKLPLPDKMERRTLNGKYRVYFNYCTISYSAVWWDWERWQRELDFMAMNGINMPLSVVGHEMVWYNTLMRIGFTDQEAREFLAGPAHSAWQWMQNLEGYGGPMPRSWMDKHVTLGKQIMERQLAMGMIPIQQGFSGYVPKLLGEKYPDASIRFQPSWCGFPGVAQLDPTDPLFREIGTIFLEEQGKLFGSHHHYAADPFHESAPPIDTPEYLDEVGRTIYGIFKDYDQDAKWIMQAWTIRESIAKAVPQDDLLILDLTGRKMDDCEGFWGYEFVAGNLHNFGGRINLHGDVGLLAQNQYSMAKEKYPNVAGTGLFMEGIIQNPVYYDLAFEMPNHHGAVDINEWLAEYPVRRYGATSKEASAAWVMMLQGPYAEGTNGVENSSIIAARPALYPSKSGPNAGFLIPYDPKILIEIQGRLLTDSSELKGSDCYRFDIVDIQRQIMSNMGQAMTKRAADAYNNRDREEFRLHSGRFLEMLADVDRLVRPRSEYSYDKWITDARSWGDNEQEKDLLEKDATTLVTIWGPEPNPRLYDYSWREWSGLIEEFYLPRWKMFYDMIDATFNQGVFYSDASSERIQNREAFRGNDFYKGLADWELQYIETYNKARSPIIEGDELALAGRYYQKYKVLSAEYYEWDEK